MIDFEAALRQQQPKVSAGRFMAVNDTGAVPAPGLGSTALRHRILSELGRADLGMARLGEAHLDALAILFEGGREPLEGVLYGVWAGDDDRVLQGRLTAERADGYWRVSGTKPHCSGAAFATAALVTADSPNGILLFEVQLNSRGIRIQRSAERTNDGGAASALGVPMADSLACAVSFDGVMLSESSVIGGPDWYMNRPGYWNGAIGPAACWAGGAQSLVEAARRLNLKDAVARAQLAALDAASWNLTSILELAGREIDADPGDAAAARRRALRVRHLIRCNCTEVLERFGYATSPELLAFDEDVARQHAALSSCIRQSHSDSENHPEGMSGVISETMSGSMSVPMSALS
jgi:hypothetical protein